MFDHQYDKEEIRQLLNDISVYLFESKESYKYRSQKVYDRIKEYNDDNDLNLRLFQK